jgi:signal transduction histidine kinase
LDLRMETLDLAKIHEEVMAQLPTTGIDAEILEKQRKRGALFFYAVVLSVLKGRDSAHLTELNLSLDQRATELADSRREIKRQIAERKSGQRALKQIEINAENLVKESAEMKQRLQTMTHQILKAHELERKEMSLQLQDEIAQTLLGIHVRLLALKKEAADSSASLTQEIATTQQLVEQSVEAIRRYATEIGIAHE